MKGSQAPSRQDQARRRFVRALTPLPRERDRPACSQTLSACAGRLNLVRVPYVQKALVRRCGHASVTLPCRAIQRRTHILFRVSQVRQGHFDGCRISGACGQAYSSCRAISPGEPCCARLSRRQNRSWILLAIIASDASGDMNAVLYRSFFQTCHRLKYGLS